MNEQKLQFRVGLFVLSALTIIGILIFQFGEFRGLTQKNYPLLVHFDSAPGVVSGSPVRLSGLNIGRVAGMALDPQNGGVLLTLNIEEQYQLRADAVPMLQQSLLGDTIIEISPGVSPQELDRATVLRGQPPVDLQALVQRMDRQLAVTLESFTATSREWQLVGRNVNSLVETNRGNLRQVVERTAASLDEFTSTMQRAAKTFDHTNQIIGDPRTIENIQKAMDGLPGLVNDTRQTIAAMRTTVNSVGTNLRNLEGVTEPLARNTTSIVTRLDQSLGNLEVLTAELRQVAEVANRRDGSLKRFLADPSLYENLEQSTAALAVLLRNMQPVLADLTVFADKVARHPELMGVGGALRPSSGLKDTEIQQTGFENR